jgi:hypothetical protein
LFVIESSIAAQPQRSLYTLCFCSLPVVQHIDVCPDIPELPEAVGEPSDQHDQNRQAAYSKIEQRPILLALAARRQTRVDDGKLEFVSGRICQWSNLSVVICQWSVAVRWQWWVGVAKDVVTRRISLIVRIPRLAARG